MHRGAAKPARRKGLAPRRPLGRVRGRAYGRPGRAGRAPEPATVMRIDWQTVLVSPNALSWSPTPWCFRSRCVSCARPARRRGRREHREYSADEQRGPAGMQRSSPEGRLRARMQADFHHGLLTNGALSRTTRILGHSRDAGRGPNRAGTEEARQAPPEGATRRVPALAHRPICLPHLNQNADHTPEGMEEAVAAFRFFIDHRHQRQT